MKKKLPSNSGSTPADVKVFGFLVIIAAICFIAVIALQVLEMSFYSAVPSVWPAQ